MDRQKVTEGLKEHESLIDTATGKYTLPDETSLYDVYARVGRVYCENSPFSDEIDKDVVEFDGFRGAGSILAGAGNYQFKSSLSNCYYTPIEEDSIEGIFEAIKKMARTYSYRGGTGTSISILRPKKEPVQNSARRSSGAVSFMPMLSETTETIGQEGRRGALIIILDVRHPDILDFIWSKSKPESIFGRDALTGKVPLISGANISVVITDDFMEAVQKDEDWTFKFPDRSADPDKYDREWDGDFDKWDGAWKEYFTMPAREVMEQIAEAAHMSAEPGILFMSTIQKNTPGSYIDESLKPIGSNPCGEEPLPDYNNCLLAPLILPELVLNPFEEDARIDTDRFDKAVRNTVRFLNVTSDINETCHPLKEQREADAYGKRIGVEFTGLADFLAMLGIEYGSSESITKVKELLKHKARIEIDESCNIAQEVGCCPALGSVEARQRFLDSPYIQNLELSDELKNRILTYGLRNTSFNTVGPTGTLSIISGNVTSGIEPLFNVSLKRKTRLTDKVFELVHKPILDYLNNLSDEELEKYSLDTLAEDFNYVEAHKLDWKDRIEMQAAVQEFTDASVSSTLNLPESATVEEVLDIYKTAYKKGLKGVTVYREGSRSGVLSASDQNGDHDKPIVHENVYVRDLLDVERAERHRIRWNGAKMYCIVSLDDDDMPVEVFVKLPREAGYDGNGMYRESVYQEKYSLWESICRLVSLHLRSSMPLSMVLKQLDKSSYSMNDASSVLARVLRTYIPEDEGQRCPNCGNFTYMHHGNCPTCTTCGHSSCG